MLLPLMPMHTHKCSAAYQYVAVHNFTRGSHRSPYIRAARTKYITTITRHIPTFANAMTVLPHPSPTASYKGKVASGRMEPPIDEAIVWAARADAG